MLTMSDWCRLIALPSTLKTSPRSLTTVRYWPSYSQLKPGAISRQGKYTGYMSIFRKTSTTNQGLIINRESCGTRRWRKWAYSHRNPLRFGRATTVRILTVSLPWSSGVYLAKGCISDYILSLSPLSSVRGYGRCYLTSNFHPIKVKTHRARSGFKDRRPRSW